ncbi:hypothetical protein BDV11DRAFT_201129 [Aspergillus similis]
MTNNNEGGNIGGSPDMRSIFQQFYEQLEQTRVAEHQQMEQQITQCMQGQQQMQQQVQQLIKHLMQQQTPATQQTSTATSKGIHTPNSPMSPEDREQEQPRHSLGDPPVYDGKEPEKYPHFRKLLGAKLQINGRAIGSPYSCMWYAFGRLAGLAADTILPWMDTHATSTATEKTLRQITFGDTINWEPTPVLARNQQQQAKWDGRCLRCGATGHQVRNCQYAPATPPPSHQPISRTVAPMLEDKPTANNKNTHNEQGNNQPL